MYILNWPIRKAIKRVEGYGLQDVSNLIKHYYFGSPLFKGEFVNFLYCGSVHKNYLININRDSPASCLIKNNIKL